MKHAYIRLETNGAISIRWWVEPGECVATRTLIHVLPDESAFGVGFDEWRRRAGEFVDLDQLQHRLTVRPTDN